MPDVNGGLTIRIILRGCETGLHERSFVEWSITALCREIGMTQVGEPFTQSIPPGLSCGLIIAESHIFIHTWPETESVRVVIDSCVDFDYSAAVKWLVDTYEAGEHEYHMTV